MRIYPRVELRPKFLGESRVYELLSRITAEPGFVVHSVNLPHHEYKRWGEADFVVVSTAGVTLLEVKGGTVSIAGREWRYANGRGQAIISTEGPARQALSAAIALEKMLSKHMGRRIRCRWGVIFPLCRFRRNVAELPAARLADIHTCIDSHAFHQWLQNIPFDQHDFTESLLSPSEIEAIRDVIVPEMCAAMSLGLAAQCARQNAVRLTDQQFQILESLEANPRLCVSGGAGTGKTELAALCARAEKVAGRSPAILAAGEPFARVLRDQMAAYDIPVVTDALPLGTDSLIVDEGQDHALPERMDALFAQLPGGLACGRWRWFMDPNLQFTNIPPDPGCLASLAASAVTVTLSRNVRSTREIVSVIGTFLDADIGVSEIDGFGIRVGFHSVTDTAREVAAVQTRIALALEDGINPSEIAVLGPAGVEGPVCRALLQRMPQQLRPLSADGRIHSSTQGRVCSIAGYRGLEARVVLLVDLDLIPAGLRGESLLYIGMSRATASLQLFVSPPVEAFLKRLIRQSFKRS